MVEATPGTPTEHAGGATPETPPTPEGYDDPELFEYSLVVLLVMSIPAFLLAAQGFGWLLWQFQGPAVVESVFEVTEDAESTVIVLNLTGVVIPFLVALLVTVIVHELLHGAVMRYYGYDVTYGVNLAMGAFYVAAFGQFQPCEELLQIGIAPLVCISALAVPVFVVPVPVVALTAYLVAVVNATGAVGDLYLLWRLWRMPEGTRMYEADLRHWYVFDPLEAGGNAD